MVQDVAEGELGATKDAWRCSSCRVVHQHLPAAEHTPNAQCRPPTLHVKDVAQDAAEDVAEGVWGAEKDGSLAVFLVARVIFQRQETPKHTRAAPRAALGRHVKGEYVKDVA